MLAFAFSASRRAPTPVNLEVAPGRRCSGVRIAFATAFARSRGTTTRSGRGRSSSLLLFVQYLFTPLYLHFLFPLAHAEEKRPGNYNMWSCPHCYDGGMAAEVSDLSCEMSGSAPQQLSSHGGFSVDEVPWGGIKTALYEIIEAVVSSSDHSPALDYLMPYLEMGTPRSRCYLGMMCLNFLKVYLHPPEDRLDFLQTTQMGGASFKKIIPLSYWDVLNSGWPLFSILDVLAQVSRFEAANGFPVPTGPGTSGLIMDMKGLEDGPGQVLLELEQSSSAAGGGAVVEDEVKALHRQFFELHKQGKAGFLGALLYLAEQAGSMPARRAAAGTLRPTSTSLPPSVLPGGGEVDAAIPIAATTFSWSPSSTESFSPSTSKPCHGGVAAAYFSLAEGLLNDAMSNYEGNGRASLETARNATKNFILFGESQVHNCMGNMTVYHHLRSEWHYWQVLSRIERRRLLPGLFWNLKSEYYIPPPTVALQTARKYSKGASSASAHPEEAAGTSAQEPDADGGGMGLENRHQKSAQAVRTEDPCLHLDALNDGQREGLVHIALSADTKQVDGFIVALNSLVRHTENLQATCVHVFLPDHELQFLTSGLQCAFQERLKRLDATDEDATSAGRSTPTPIASAAYQGLLASYHLFDQERHEPRDAAFGGGGHVGTEYVDESAKFASTSASSIILTSTEMDEAAEEDEDHDDEASTSAHDRGRSTSSTTPALEQHQLRLTPDTNRGAMSLLFHRLDEELVASKGRLRGSSFSARKRFTLGGDVDVSRGFQKDTGNLQALHNYVRFYLHALLPAAIRHVLYFDVDILIKKDPRQLWEEYLPTLAESQATVCAAIRPSSPLFMYLPGIMYPYMPEWIPINNPAFNAGVLFIHLERWRQRPEIQEKLDMWLASRDESGPETLWRHGSQPLMLLLFHDEACKLPYRWNVDGLGHRLNYPKHVLTEGGLFHWTGPLKPWKEDGVNRLLWEPYTLNYCPQFSHRVHTTTCRPDSWYC